MRRIVAENRSNISCCPEFKDLHRLMLSLIGFMRQETKSSRFDDLMEKAKERAPARALVTIEDVGMATAFLATDYAKLITGDTMYFDGGYHIVG